eukprot:GEMP01002344.1.p1 GENE.GEMP01002344.1~~GEMP01002344.1.p1  ORF type:complete len:949 (+),score=181.75 GEMP01002344.1:173-3019(+)
MELEYLRRTLRALIGLSLYVSATSDSVHTITEEQKKGIRSLFNLSETAQDTVESMATLGVTGMGVYLVAFLVLRPLIPRIYLLRRLTGDVVYKPERWLRNMLWISSEEAFEAGISMDGCMHILGWTFALRVTLGLLLLMPLPLCINWFGAGFLCPENTKEYYTVGDSTERIYCGSGFDDKGKKYSPFVRLTMAAFEAENPMAWGHIVTLWIITVIVVVELNRANNVFTELRSKWLLQRDKPVASSIMGMNVTARSDKEFRDIFEELFPGKVVDARLVKFCKPLANTCEEIENIEEKLKIQEMKAAAKEKKHQGTESTASSVDEQQPDEDAPLPAQKRGQVMQVIPGALKVTSAVRGLIAPDLRTKLAQLLAKKRELQDDLLERAVKRTQEVEILRQEEEHLRRTGKEKETTTMISPQDIRKGLVAIKGIVPLSNDDVFSKIGFVTFINIRTATLAVQASYSNDSRNWQMTMAPDPKDVLWKAIATMNKSANQELNYVILVASTLIFILWSAVVAVVQRLIDKLFKMWTDTLGPEPSPIVGLLQGIISTLALLVFLAILPKIVFKLLIISGRMVKSVACLDLQSFIVLFKVVFIIYATSLGKPMEELGAQIFKGSKDVGFEFDIKSTFGTSVPSEFPKHFAFCTAFLIAYASELLLQDVYVHVALQYFVFRRPWEYAWKIGRRESTHKMTNPRRFISLTVMMTICLMIYQVAPLNILLFVLLFFLGSASIRYRVLYTDNGLVDSGGLYWVRFSSHIIISLIVVQISACVVLTSILQGIWTIVATVPLPVWCFFLSKKMKQARWEFVTLQHPDLRVPDVEAGHDEPNFPYVQPQLEDACLDEKKDEGEAAKETAMYEEVRDDDAAASGSAESDAVVDSEGSKPKFPRSGSPSFKKGNKRKHALANLEQGTARHRRSSAASSPKELETLHVAVGEIGEGQGTRAPREVSPE